MRITHQSAPWGGGSPWLQALVEKNHAFRKEHTLQFINHTSPVNPRRLITHMECIQVAVLCLPHQLLLLQSVSLQDCRSC